MLLLRETLAQSVHPTASPSLSQGWAYYSSYNQSACTGNVYAVVAMPLSTCIPQYNLTSIIYFYKYSCDSSGVTTNYYSNSACDQTSANLPSTVFAPIGCAYSKFNMTTNLQCTANTQSTALIPTTGYYWAINTTYAAPYALNTAQSCGPLSQMVIVLQTLCYVNTGLGSASGVNSFKVTYSSSLSQFIISTYSNYGCSSTNPGSTTLYTYCAPYAIGNNYYAKELWTFTSTAAPTHSPTTITPSFIPTSTANPSSMKPSASPSSRKPSMVPSSATPTFATAGYLYFNSYSTKSNCSSDNAIVGITAYPLLTCIPVFSSSSSIPIYYSRYSCDSKLANTTLYSDAQCTKMIQLVSSQPVGTCSYKSMNLTASLQCTNSSNLVNIIPFIAGVTWNINRTYANSYTTSSQSCSANLLKVAQVYRNNYCFPSTIGGSGYQSFSTSGSTTLVNSYSSGGCTGTKTSVKVYGYCQSYTTNSSTELYVAQYWTFLYSNAPPTFKPTYNPTSESPTYSPSTRRPTFAPSTRRPSSSLTGYAYFNSYSGSKCTGKVAAVTAYPIGICIPQYNVTSIVRYVYYDCDQTAITASYFKDSSCVINSTHPVTYPIANSSCIYSVLNLTAAAFLNVIQMYLNTFCYNYPYSSRNSFLTKSSGFVSSYVNAQCGSGIFSSINVYTTCTAYITNGGTYVQNIWTLGFSYNLPSTSPTRIPSISFAPTYGPSSITPFALPTIKPTYGPSSIKPSVVPTIKPTIGPTTTLSGYAYFYSYTIKGCTGSIVAVTAYPLGSCIPQYNATSIKNYIKYSCDSRFANATTYVDSSCTIRSSSPQSLTTYPLLTCAYSVLNYSSNVQCSSSTSYLDIVPSIPGSVWMINVSYAAPFNYNPSGSNMMCDTINIVQMYQNSWCFAYSQNGYKSFKVSSSLFYKYSQNSACTGILSSTSLKTTCSSYSVASVEYVTNNWILNYAITKPPSGVPSLSPTTSTPSSVKPSCKPTSSPSTRLPSNSPSSRTPTKPSATPTTRRPSISTAPIYISTTAPSLEPAPPTSGPSFKLPTAIPTLTWTQYPTDMPNLETTVEPTSELTMMPTLEPTISPIELPTVLPTLVPSTNPSVSPSETSLPSTSPSTSPSDTPSVYPTDTTIP
eukprot:gene22808-29534_t